MTPKTTAVDPPDRVAEAVGAAVWPGEAVAVGVAAVGVATGAAGLVPQDTVSRTAATGSSRRRFGPTDRVLVTSLRRPG
jgi:hypothetical protein